MATIKRFAEIVAWQKGCQLVAENMPGHVNDVPIQGAHSGNQTILGFSWEGVGTKMKATYEWLLDPVNVTKSEYVKL